jgi:hypothetical protein
MARIIKLGESVTNIEVKIGNNNFEEEIFSFTNSVFSEEIKKTEEHLFIITLKRRIVMGAYITNIGCGTESAVYYGGLAKYALDDNADEVIVGHNHSSILNTKPISDVYASCADLLVFYNIFEMFSLLEIRAVCSVFTFTENNKYATFYYGDNSIPSSVLKEAGWVNTVIKEGKGKRKKETCPYVKLDTKKDDILFKCVKLVYIPSTENDKGKNSSTKRSKK